MVEETESLLDLKQTVGYYLYDCLSKKGVIFVA